MRPRALLLASILPVALAFAPSTAAAQRNAFDRCRDRFGDCSFDRDVARRARERALRVRDEMREITRANRAEARLRERPIPAARVRADVMRERLRDRIDARRYERRGRNRLSW